MTPEEREARAEANEGRCTVCGLAMTFAEWQSGAVDCGHDQWEATEVVTHWVTDPWTGRVLPVSTVEVRDD